MRSKAGGDRLRFVEFQLPTLVDMPPEGDDWIHEVKYDGYRTELIIERGSCRAFTRNGLDWSANYAPIVKAAVALPVKSAIIDGEVIVMNNAGVSDFQALRSAIRWAPERLVFIGFDLLHLDGADLRLRPLIERRAMLAGLIGDAAGAIQVSHHLEGSGKAVYTAVETLGLEGMVSKRADATYRSGPSKRWLKTKCYEESEYEVAGVLREPGRPTMAYMVTRDPERRYAGGAFVALDKAMRERLMARVHKKALPPKGIKPKVGSEWLKPGLVGRVKHLKGEQLLRHATLHEIREEKG